MNYWEECIRESFDEAGIVATEKQVQSVAGDVEGAHENYSLATGEECIPNPLQTELDKTKRDLEIERSKETCKECGGEGRITTPGPYHSSNSECWKCRGEGKTKP